MKQKNKKVNIIDSNPNNSYKTKKNFTGFYTEVNPGSFIHNRETRKKQKPKHAQWKVEVFFSGGQIFPSVFFISRSLSPQEKIDGLAKRNKIEQVCKVGHSL